MKFGPWVRLLTASAAAALGLAACGGGGGIGGTGGSMGTMRVSMTDAPACGYDHVWVTVKNVRVHQSSAAVDGDTGWTDLPVDAPNGRRIDLLTLRNGVQTELGLTALPAGTYQQMRLVLAGNTGNAAPFANAVYPTGDQERALDTPSGQQTGLKLNVNVTVPEGQEAHVLLDFDACKSIVKAGNSGKYNLKPVIAVTTLLQDAGLRVLGVVAPGLVNAATSVSVQASGPNGPVVAKATTPAADGSFVLYPVPANTYSLVITSPGYPTSVMTGVPVVSGTPTTVSNTTVPLAPAVAASGPRTAAGTLTPATGSVRALQAFQGGPTIEVQAAPVDATTRAFTFSLPVAAAQTTPYVANLGAVGSFPWTIDASTPLAYTIQATAADGVTTKAVGPFSVLAPTLPSLDISFP
jgi:hypothetical protein